MLEEPSVIEVGNKEFDAWVSVQKFLFTLVGGEVEERCGVGHIA